MRALITGGKGFVGQWLAAHLKDVGDDVVAIDVETDISDGPALRQAVMDAAPEMKRATGRAAAPAELVIVMRER